MSRKFKNIKWMVSVLFVTSAVYTMFMFGTNNLGAVNKNREFVTSRIPSANLPTKQKVVVLFSNQRSGSSFMGEFFNRNPAAFYLYEPLFPFTPHCDVLKEQRVEALENMLRCDFSRNADFFHLADSLRELKVSQRGSTCNIVCFPFRSQALQRSLKQRIRNSTYKTHRPSINVTSLSHLCKGSNLIAYKILRICDLRAIDDIYKRISLQGKDLYIIHLLRDPRGIISSKLQLVLKQHEMENRTKELCAKMERNVLLASNASEPLSFVQDGRYFQVRYEDAAMDPLGMAENIYSFLGLGLPGEVRKWLEISVFVSNKAGKAGVEAIQLSRYKHLAKTMRDAYSTIKDSSVTVRKWRKLLHIDTVSEIQKICSVVLEKLNYRTVWSTDALLDFSIDLW